MKILLAVHLFFLFVFVHGMEEERSGDLAGIWKCVGQDTQRNLDKPFAFFNEDGTGNWLVGVPDRAKIDSRFKFTVFSKVGNTYKIRWENELNESGTRDVILEGDTLLFEGKKWLQKLNIDGIMEQMKSNCDCGTLVGTWKCVGWDEARCIGKFVFFNKDGSGFWNVESPDRGTIDPSFKYLVEQKRMRHSFEYIIHWFNEHAGYGTVITVLKDNQLHVTDEQPSYEYTFEKLWLQKLNKKEENGNEIILENITWDLSDEKIEDNDTEGNEEFIWHIIDSSKILNGDYSITPLPVDFEEQINRLYKSAPYTKISEEKCWWLVLHGKFKTSYNPFHYRVPFSPKRIDINVQPGEMELNKILEFGIFEAFSEEEQNPENFNIDGDSFGDENLKKNAKKKEKSDEKKSLFSCCCPGKKETITYKKK